MSNNAERQRDNLLARIFRDGGQKQDSFSSVDEACEAADLLVAEAYGELEELRLKSGQDVMKTSKPNKQSQAK